MTCKNCGSEFRRNNGKQKFCNTYCQLNYYYTNVTKPKAEGKEIPLQKPISARKTSDTMKWESGIKKQSVIESIKQKYRVGQQIEFCFKDEYKKTPYTGLITQTTDALIIAKNGNRTHTILWVDIYTQKAKIQLKRSNIA